MQGILRAARQRSGLSQRALASRAGTSGAAVAAYESGAKDPRASTCLRIIRASGADLTLTGPRSRNDRFVDLMCARYAELLAENPSLLEAARSELPRLGESSNRGVWERLLDLGVPVVAAVLTSPLPEVRGLKSDCPFAFLPLISDAERNELLRAAHGS